MREMMLSMMRFSGAVTMFGLEQIQNAMSAPADTQAALVRLCGTLDSMSGVLESKLDASTKKALHSLSKAQLDVLDSTSNAVNLDAVNMDAATDFIKRTSEKLSGMMAGPENGSKAAGGAA
jgi:hypothetical protein